MNLLPYFGKLETRDTGYSDTIIRQIQRAASGSGIKAIPGATAAAEVASGYIQRAFMGAEVTGFDLLTPDLMGTVGRTMARNGEIVLYRSGRTLIPAHTVTLTGGPDPDSWEYQLSLPGPSKTRTVKRVSAGNVLHFRWAVDVSKPWRGVGPLQSAEVDAQLMAELTKALEEECAQPHGSFLPIPKTGGQDASVSELKADIASAKGAQVIVESMADGWQSGSRGQTNSDWMVKRFGANFPAPLVTLYEKVFYMVLAAFGINPQLIMQGSDTREAWRVMLFSLIRPVANGIEAELSSKLGTRVRLQFDDMRASDIQGRARAYKSLVDGGMPGADAARICAFEG